MNYIIVVMRLHFCYDLGVESAFGSRLRTDTLVAVARLGPTYTAELARLLERRPNEIQRAVASLESAGLIASQLLGRTRIIELNAKYVAAEELAALLLKLSRLPEYEKRWRAFLAGRTKRR